jgi:putative ATP-dependent endonuclease of the OLD family
MAIRRVSIENYRSIEMLDLEFSNLNALVGANSSGKSNILRALNTVLGETWPTRPFTEKDYFQHDLTRTIHIQVHFDAALRCDPTVQGFWLRCPARQPPEFIAIDRNGHECYWPNGTMKRVNTGMREEAALVFLGLDREAETQLRTSQWTLYGKLLRHIESTMPPATKAAFIADVTNTYRTNIEPSLTNAQRIMDNLVRRQTGLNIQLELHALNPLEVVKNVRPRVVEPTMVVDPEECGAGVQGAIAVAIAKAYAEIIRNPVVLAIEEPELFYALLQEMARGGLQVIYTTHERSFVDAGNFDLVHIIRKINGLTEVTSGRQLNIQGRDRLRVQSRFNDRVNELFFAAAVVLVEGDPDEIACRAAMEALHADLDRRSISIISVSGQTEMPVFAELLTGLKVSCVALMDEDPGNAASAATRQRVGQYLPAANLILQRPNLETVWGLPQKPSKVESMTTFPARCANPANIPPLYADVRDRLRRAVP